MKNVLIVNTQALGDCLLGTHTARLYKEKNPDDKVFFCVRKGLSATTAENESNLELLDILMLLSMQEGIHNVGVVDITATGLSLNLLRPEEVNFDRVIIQNSWYSDLGIVASQSAELLAEDYTHYSNTETKFSVGIPKLVNQEILTIGIVGPLDWNRKLKNDFERIKFLQWLKAFLDSKDTKYRVTFFGRDVQDKGLLQDLRELQACNLFIGPVGLLSHAAAGLQVDTITFSSVYPAIYDCPEYYHSGLHQTIKAENHCGTYACVEQKLFSNESHKNNRQPEGPKTLWGFWPKRCSETTNKLSCVTSISAESIAEAVTYWYRETYEER